MASVAPREWTYKGKKKSAWTVRYIDKSGAHRSKACKSKKEADAFKRKVENELEAGTHIARRQTRTIGQIAEEYLLDCRQRRKDGQLAAASVRRSTLLLGYVCESLAGFVATDLKWTDVDKAAREWRQRKGAQNQRPMAKSTLKNTLWQFKHMMAWAQRRDYVARNVVAEAMGEIGEIAVDRIETFTIDQIKDLMRAVEDRQKGTKARRIPMLRACLYLGAFCGLRRGEIFALTLDAIDFESGMIHITQALTEFDEIRPPKTKAGIRSVPMPPEVAAALRAWLPWVVGDKSGRGLLFRTTNGGNLIRGDAFYKNWNELLDRAGIPRTEAGGWVHFHALRHFAGSFWIQGGATIPEVSQLLGHANPAITARVYAHSLTRPAHHAALLSRCATALLPPPDTQALRIAA